MKRFAIILAILLPICFAQVSFSQEPFRLGFVPSFDEDGDTIWLANTKKRDRTDSKAIVRFGNFGKSPSGKINIDGRDIVLKFVNEFSPDRNFKVGRGGYQIWKVRNATVRLDYVFTWLCPPKYENCEVYYYKGFLEVKYKKLRRKVNVIGYGGS